jgi:two-component system chemotaxis response regulator CheB
MPASRKPIRVLIVDDSASVRQTLARVLASDPDITVLGIASDPFIAAARIRDEVPDVITLDVEMPRMDGITFLRKLMAQHPIPVVMCSSLVEAGSETLMQALEAGAVDVILKPRMDVSDHFTEIRDHICEVVKGAAQARVGRMRARGPGAAGASAAAGGPPMSCCRPRDPAPWRARRRRSSASAPRPAARNRCAKCLR